MKRDHTKVSNDDAKAACLASLSMAKSIEMGHVKPILELIELAFSSISGSASDIREGDRIKIKMDVARVISNQIRPKESRDLKISNLDRLAEKLNEYKSFDSFLGSLGGQDLAEVRDICDLYMRIGLIQLDKLSDYTGNTYIQYSGMPIVGHDIRQARSGLGIFNEAVLINFFNAYAAYSKASDLFKTTYMTNSGPNL